MSEERHVLEQFSLRGRVALISGATGHLGSAMARALAEAGASVIVSSRRLADAQEVAAHLPENGSRHYGVAIDHMDEHAWKADSPTRWPVPAGSMCWSLMDMNPSPPIGARSAPKSSTVT